MCENHCHRAGCGMWFPFYWCQLLPVCFCSRVLEFLHTVQREGALLGSKMFYFLTRCNEQRKGAGGEHGRQFYDRFRHRHRNCKKHTHSCRGSQEGNGSEAERESRNLNCRSLLRRIVIGVHDQCQLGPFGRILPRRTSWATN